MITRTERFELRLEPDLLDRVDDWRAAQRDVPSRSAAVRRLVEQGLGRDNDDQLFELTRFQLLLAAKAGAKLPPAYVYAWDTGVYPALHDGAQLHVPFATHFEIPGDRLVELAKYLDERDLADDVPTFYQLEDYCDVRSGRSFWDRFHLIAACRYLRLEGRFGKLWGELLAPGDHPIEAKSIVEDFDPASDVYLA